MREKRAEAVAELKAALAELESGEGLRRFTGGHGLQSRVFEFEWREPTRNIDFRLPYARVLSGEETQASDDAEIGAAIRMAVLLLTTRDSLVSESRIDVSCDDTGASYHVYNADGVLEDFGDEWGPLVKRLETILNDNPGDMTIIWP